MGSTAKQTALALLLCLSGARAFPIYTAANGTTVLASAFGGNVVLQPSFSSLLRSESPLIRRSAHRTDTCLALYF
jgi:hypothetical protein